MISRAMRLTLKKCSWNVCEICLFINHGPSLCSRHRGDHWWISGPQNRMLSFQSVSEQRWLWAGHTSIHCPILWFSTVPIVPMVPTLLRSEVYTKEIIMWRVNILNSMVTQHTEKAMATHSSTLAWKIPWMEEPGRLKSMGSRRVGHLLSNFTFTFMHWRRKWQPTPVFLPGESQGRRSLVGCHLWGRTESDTTEAT